MAIHIEFTMSSKILNKSTEFNNSFKGIKKHETQRQTAIRLEQALRESKQAADVGYSIAKNNLNDISNSINETSVSISKRLDAVKQSRINSPETVESLDKQLTEVVKDLKRLHRQATQDLRSRHERLEKFSITLFGRTMAGKSTLMEILKEGEGSSIGLGSQRTTRDIRHYTWKGLEIADVPGIAAFEGEADEDLAFEAAKQADLVIFLITDDSPQASEAKCLARVRKLGKPVIGICNIKVALDDPDDFIIFLHKRDTLYDLEDLNEQINQFNILTDEYLSEQSVRINFISTHLRARFLANQSNFSAYKDELIKISRFAEVEKSIINEVLGSGKFLRVKSFIDSSYVPMMELTSRLLEFSEINSQNGRILVGKSKQLNQWLTMFKDTGQERINNLISRVVNTLKNKEAPSFIEDYYGSKDAGKEWTKLIDSMDINRKVKSLQEELSEEFKKNNKEIVRELESEFEFISSFNSNNEIDMNNFFDKKKVWNWGVSITAGVLGVASIITGVAILGAAAAGVGILGAIVASLFDSRDKRVDNAREKLSESINKNITKIEKQLKKDLGYWFKVELLKKNARSLSNDLNTLTSELFALADTQRKLASDLNSKQKLLSKNLINESFEQLGKPYLMKEIIDIARVPGEATMLMIEPNVEMPRHIKNDLSRLLGEQIWFVINTKNANSIIRQSVGRSCKSCSIEEGIDVAHVSLAIDDSVTQLRIKLAQQLTSLQIVIRNKG